MMAVEVVDPDHPILSSGMLADGAQALLEVQPDADPVLYLPALLSLDDQLGLLEFADEMLSDFLYRRDDWEDDGRGVYRTWLSLEWVEPAA